MAKKFTGFKPETMEKKILPALGYTGAMDQKSINAFLASNPAAAAKMGKYTMVARQMVEGKPINAFSGNLAQRLQQYKALPASQRTASAHQAAIRGGSSPGDDKRSTPKPAASPAPAAPAAATTSTPATSTPSTPAQPGQQTGGSNSAGGMPSGAALTRQIGEDPTKPVTTAKTVAETGDPNQVNIDASVGQMDPTKTVTPEAATVEEAAQSEMPEATEAPQMEVATAAEAVGKATDAVETPEGEVSEDAQVQAAQTDPTQASQLQLQAAQLGQSQTVDAPQAMEVSDDQLIDGSTVDQSRVSEAFGTGEVKAATVSGELENLMQDFEGGDTPAWAAGAMRAANAAMAARGLSSSSMAGMAVVQAAMESALPIAQMDASNKQQMAMMKAEQRAKFMGMEFDQNFQAKVKNAARVSEIANINFTADQQVALENAKMAQTVDLANLSNKQAKVMADAATMSQMDMANLNNRQQAAVQNAQSFLQMDMQNLSNEQQVTMFKAQENVNALLSDTAADNASRQFNATSQQQTDQFFASLGAQVSQFNTEQTNAMARFNAGETNALAQFNAAQENARDQFNAQNHLVIAQANAQWAQSTTTAENAAANQANRDAALASNNLTMTAYNNTVQRERDLLAWAWQSGENSAERANAIATAQINANGKGSQLLETATGSFLGKLTSKAVDLIF